MLERTQLLRPIKSKDPEQQNKNEQQIDMYTVALELQTISLMLNDLRNRVLQIEKQVHIGDITETDRALLSNLDLIFEKSRPTTPMDPREIPSIVAEAPRAGTRVLDWARILRSVDE
jgi:hypothetical protein